MKKSGVEFETEDDLKKAQTADERFGKPVATPDFFFKAPITVNGKLLNWLEIRNYPMFDLEGVVAAPADSGASAKPLSKIVKNVLRQSSKYNRHFGNGAFVFRGMQADMSLGDDEKIEMIDGAALI